MSRLEETLRVDASVDPLVFLDRPWLFELRFHVDLGLVYYLLQILHDILLYFQQCLKSKRFEFRTFDILAFLFKLGLHVSVFPSESFSHSGAHPAPGRSFRAFRLIYILLEALLQATIIIFQIRE
jgi:hypothetical protein